MGRFCGVPEWPVFSCPLRLTGHIDIVQVRGHRVWILDYKPDAKREKRAKFQIYLYARALSQRTGIPLRRFGMAYFDDKDYFEVSLARRWPA